MNAYCDDERKSHKFLLTLIITDNSRMKTECCLLNLKAICERSSSLDLNFEGEWEKKECDHKGQR